MCSFARMIVKFDLPKFCMYEEIPHSSMSNFYVQEFIGMYACMFVWEGGGVVHNKFLASTIFRAGGLLEDLWLLALNLVKQVQSVNRVIVFTAHLWLLHNQYLTHI